MKKEGKERKKTIYIGKMGREKKIVGTSIK
jgi:hypothetical protein